MRIATNSTCASSPSAPCGELAPPWARGAAEDHQRTPRQNRIDRETPKRKTPPKRGFPQRGAGLVSEDRFDPLEKLVLRQGADLCCRHLAVLEQHQGRNPAHAIFLRCLLILVDVHL